MPRSDTARTEVITKKEVIMKNSLRYLAALVVATCLTTFLSPVWPQGLAADKPCKAAYVGELQLRVNDDGRTMTLLSAYGYGDEKCTLWSVPAGAIVDGASIPLLFQSFIGSPYVGKYRNASVIHDWFCDRRTMPWERVHRVFYEAMRTSEVEEFKAKLMYLAVYYRGPRWDMQAMMNNRLVNKSIPLASAGLDPEMLKRYKEVAFARESGLSAGVRFIAERIKRNDIDLNQIDRLAEQARAIDGLSDAKLPPLK